MVVVIVPVVVVVSSTYELSLEVELGRSLAWMSLSEELEARWCMHGDVIFHDVTRNWI